MNLCFYKLTKLCDLLGLLSQFSNLIFSIWVCGRICFVIHTGVHIYWMNELNWIGFYFQNFFLDHNLFEKMVLQNDYKRILNFEEKKREFTWVMSYSKWSFILATIHNYLIHLNLTLEFTNPVCLFDFSSFRFKLAFYYTVSLFHHFMLHINVYIYF